MTAEVDSRRPDAYAREIERRWARLLDRPVVLSPKDWALISDWHARSIPLSLVLESMQHAVDRPALRRAPSGLRYVAPVVEEAWQVVVDGRRSRDSAEEAPSPASDPIRAWRRRLEAEGEASGLRHLLSELLAELEGGETAETIDRRLDERLPEQAPEALLATWQRRVDAELAPFVERMDLETLERTRRAALIDRLRRALGLPHLRRADG
jgi:hypothetical protein